jgi:predicted RNase H-like HicB family nuclease
MKELIFMVEEDVDGGFYASALGLSIHVQGETIAELKSNIKDAVKCHFDDEEDIPGIIRLHQVKEEVFTYA